jgi:hypothetical protein
MRQALLCLVGSTFLTLTLSLSGLSLWKKYHKEKRENPKYQIKAIIQTGPEKEALKTAYLAEKLNLSGDEPQQLYLFDLKKGEELLLSSPLIASAHLSRLSPSTLYIDYEVRKPIAWLADFKNTAVDLEGHLFPVHPFLSPKSLPEIYLGISSFENWHIDTPGYHLAMKILQFLDKSTWMEHLTIQRIDVSNAFAESLGQREVVLITQEEIVKEDRIYIFPKILRLAPKDFEGQLTHFFTLRRTMLDDYKKQLIATHPGGTFAPRIIDLRIPHLAFIEKS